MRLRRCGADGVLVELGSLDEVAAARAALARLPGIVELVPAARTVLVVHEPGVDVAAALTDLTSVPPGTGDLVELPVVYDGPDLDLVAETGGLRRDEVAELHASAEYVVAFCGFAPGFGYLTGLPEPLVQPRLDSPRPSVPAGSVGVAGEFTGVYPRSSPGGWRLIGTHAGEPLFDDRRDRPSRLAPGDRVRFTPCAR